MKISQEVHEDMVREARSQAPLEACGLLGGPEGKATRFYPCVNQAKSPVFFTIDPGELLRLFRQMDDEGISLQAIFHSHPATEAYPSPTDVLHAHYPETPYLVLSLKEEPPVLGAFWIRKGEIRKSEWGFETQI